jgi:hypothetical protein
LIPPPPPYKNKENLKSSEAKLAYFGAVFEGGGGDIEDGRGSRDEYGPLWPQAVEAEGAQLNPVGARLAQCAQGQQAPQPAHALYSCTCPVATYI